MCEPSRNTGHTVTYSVLTNCSLSDLLFEAPPPLSNRNTYHLQLYYVPSFELYLNCVLFSFQSSKMRKRGLNGPKSPCWDQAELGFMLTDVWFQTHPLSPVICTLRIGHLKVTQFYFFKTSVLNGSNFDKWSIVPCCYPNFLTIMPPKWSHQHLECYSYCQCWMLRKLTFISSLLLVIWQMGVSEHLRKMAFLNFLKQNVSYTKSYWNTSLKWKDSELLT